MTTQINNIKYILYKIKYILSIAIFCFLWVNKSIAQPTIDLFSGMNNQVYLQKNGYKFHNGMHYVVWSNGIHGGSYNPSAVFDGFVKLSTSPDGLVWTTQNILPATTYGTWGHVLTVDNAGKIHIAYTKGTQLGFFGGHEDGIMVYANNVSGTWTEVSPNLGNGTALPYNFHEARELTWGADGKLRLYFTNSTGWYAQGAPLQVRVWEAGINDWTAPITISTLDDAPNGADSQRNVYLFSKIVAGKMQVYTLDAYRLDCSGCTPIYYSNVRIFEENPTTYAHTLIGTIPNFRHYTESIDGLFNFTVDGNGLDMKLNTQPFFTLPAAEVIHYPQMWIDQNSEFIVTNSGNQSRVFNRVTGAVVNQISNQFMIPCNGFQLIADNTSNPKRLYRFVNPTITAPSALSFTASGGNQNAPIVATTCTGGWSAVSNQSWLTFTPATGVNGTTNMTITASNNTGAVRTGTITITGCNGAVVKVITVTQNAGNIIGSTPITEILYNSPAPAYIVGTSNAIVYNNKITVAAGMFPSTKPGYPDPSIWSTQVKLIDENGLTPNGSIYNGYVQMYEFPIRNHPTNTKIGFAYETPTFGYSFNLPYSVWNGTTVESTETAFTNANWGWSPRFQYNNAGQPRITSFAHAGYYLLYHHKDGGSWVNNSVTGFGTHYSPRASVMHNNSYYFVARQNTGVPNLVLFKEDVSWTPEIITTSASDVSDLKINGTDIYALYTDNAQVKLAKRPLTGGAWTIETVVAQDSVYHRGTIFFASDNTPYVSFVKGQVTNAELKVYKKTAGTWGMVFSNPCLQFHSSYWSHGQNPTMIQKDGKVYVLYSDNYNVYLTNLNGVPTGLSVSPTSLAFGNVTAGSSTSQTFTVTNVGTSPVVVQSVNYPTGYAGTFAGGTIAGGASLVVTVTFAPTTSGTFNGVVRMNVDGVCGGYIVNVTGNVCTPTLTNNIGTTYYTNQTSLPIVASPVGSTFSISGNPITTLNPNTLGVGSFTVIQAFTDANGCSNTLSKIINILAPPVMTNSTGNTCWTNDPVTIDANATLTGSGNLTEAIVNFGTGYNSAQDRLIYPAVLFGVTGTFDIATGVLKLTGTATYAQYQQILRTIQYQNISASPAYGTTKPINFTIGDALPFSGTQHFYKFIPAPAITWTDAKTQAEALTYFGLQGYLVTITSAQENAFAFNSIAQNGWIGASDDIAYNGAYSPNGEGAWYWVTGPEKGTRFWQGLYGSGSVIGGNYVNWDNNQPDNCCTGENFAQFWVSAGFGKWNDLHNSLAPSLISGYYVEFGGMPNEPILQTTSTKSVELATKLDFALATQICTDAPTITLAGLPTGGTFKVNGVSATQINPSALGVGTHTVLYEKAGCTIPATKTIIINPLPTLAFVGLNNAYCVSLGAITLQASPVGGTFTINGNAGTVFNPSLLGAGTHTVVYSFTDVNSCTNTKTQSVVVNPLPVLNFVGLNNAYCVDANAITLQATPAGGIFTINGTNATSFNPNALGAGTYTVVYSFTDANACTNTKTQSVVVNPLPILNFVGLNNAYCVSANAVNLSATPVGGTFTINGNPATQFNPAILGAGIYNVVYSFTNGNGCSDTKAQSVTINALPVLNFVSLNNSYCIDVPTFVLSASPIGGTFTINGNTATQFNPSLLGAGTHNVVYSFTDINGCTNTKTQTVTINPLPVLNFVGLPDRYCPEGIAIPLVATPMGGTFTINGAVKTTLNPLEYSVGNILNIKYTFTNQFGCVNNITKNVSILHPDFYQDIAVDTMVCPNPYSGAMIEAITEDELQNLTSSGEQITFSWSNGSTNRTIFVGGNNYGVLPLGTYSVIVRNQSGCHFRKKSFTIKAECKPQIFVPTAFSPNGDGLNDKLEVFGGEVSDFQMTIYNRWGEIVFISYDMKEQWDGNFNGQPAPNSTYVWKLSYKHPLNREEYNQNGAISVIR